MNEDELKKTAPWEIYADEANAHLKMSESSDSVASLAKGSKFTGTVHTDEETNIEWIQFGPENSPLYVMRCRAYRVHPDNVTEGNLKVGEEKVNRWWAVPLDYEADDLVVIPKEYRSDKDREYQLRKEAADALVEMFETAEKEGIIIRVNSAYRSGEYQTKLYTRAIGRSGCEQRYSAPPGHSEHQLGTCVDLTDPESEFAFTEEFGTTPQGKWLEANAKKFGFYRSYYPENVEETGYISEPWHWRYKGKAQQ